MRLDTKDTYFRKYEASFSYLVIKNIMSGYIILIRENSQPWGSVFNTKNGLPVPLVVIRLIRTQDKKIASTQVTDVDGRFSFVIPPGDYYLIATKDGYQFPSQRIKEGYHGELIKIDSTKESLIKLNIPIDIKG
jgi:hypothetical protein